MTPPSSTLGQSCIGSFQLPRYWPLAAWWLLRMCTLIKRAHTHICNDYINTHTFYIECTVYCLFLLAHIYKFPSTPVGTFNALPLPLPPIFNNLFFTFSIFFWNFHPFLLSIITRFCVKSYTSLVSGRSRFYAWESPNV